ncbi:MAG: hypothetical protein OSA84_06300 [Akkermansiaceae bacterium]|nr:hypothetical protein [Akkermansiaceae bacterium]
MAPSIAESAPSTRALADSTRLKGVSEINQILWLVKNGQAAHEDIDFTTLNGREGTGRLAGEERRQSRFTTRRATQRLGMASLIAAGACYLPFLFRHT